MIVITVAPGQTLYGIAGSNYQAVAAANGIANPNLIFPGEQIDLGGVEPAPQPVQASPSSIAPVAAVPGSFQSCVIQHENSGSYSWGDGDGGGAYQFEPSTWAEFAPAGAEYGSASPAQQDQAFQNAVAAGDSSAWSSYDGC
jgi:LysM domain